MTFINGRRVLQMAWAVPLLLVMNVTYADLVVITHPSNPTASLTTSDVRSIYLGKMKRWENGATLAAIDQRAPSPTRDEFYETVVRKHINPRIGGIALRKLTSLHVEALLADLERSGLTSGQRAKVFEVFRIAMRKAIAQKLIRDNPSDGITPPKRPTREVQPLSAEEAERLLDCAKETRYEALFVLALGTGLRWGELAGLRWGDIDFNRATLQVQRIVVHTKHEMLIHEPKTKSGRRQVPIPGFALQALRAHRSRQSAAPHPTAWVFTNRVGAPIHKSNFFARDWKPLRERAGVPNARFHDLRHTTASLLLKRGVHPKVVQAVLGHARFGVTMDLYSHLMDGMHQEAAEALDSLLGTS